ncbi:4'-phosphopantetheinyl transferase [Mariannaea sp. PMI_226]|nr:4'-phosphopantetheinyl transferase [Mariannaea sp. PMI_226]
MTSNSAPTVIQWVLDTRSLWPSALQTQHLRVVASRALALLPKDEQANVLRYYHVRDAKLALGSVLLKRYVISRFCNVPWDQAVAVRDERTKPVFRLPDGSQPLLFNVSHQAGLVVLLAVHSPPPGVSVGVDVVCPSERRSRDHQMLTKEGWPSFVDMHAEVFGKDEVITLKRLPFAQSTDSGRDTLLRYFYALWCLREAYVKMTGDALLASWLGDLEMRGFAPPEEKQTPQEVWLRGSQLDNVDVRLAPLLDEYMVSTAIRKGDGGEQLAIGQFLDLDIEEVLLFAENNSKPQ